jgi:hypothetical protein
MPDGAANFILAGMILALKMLLLPWFLQMPGTLCYLGASTAETACYLLGWNDAPLSAAVPILGIFAAVESTQWALGAQSDAERSAVRSWCLLLGLVFCASQFAAGPLAYPRYPQLIYEVRFTASVFSVGYLTALLGYCFAGSVGITEYVIHSYILLLRVTTFGALLLVRDRGQWFKADLVGEAVNVLTLSAWLWLIPPRINMKSAV